MILSVHAIFGAATASLIPNHPIAGFVLGFTSHLVLDAIPHKDYELVSLESDPNTKVRQVNLIMNKFRLLRDIILVSFDALLGFSLAFLFFFDFNHPWIFFIGAFAALIPDGLTFLYLLIKHRALSHFFDFHTDFIHYKIHINQVLGVILQFCTVSIFIAIIYGVKYYLSIYL